MITRVALTLALLAGSARGAPSPPAPEPAEEPEPAEAPEPAEDAPDPAKAPSDPEPPEPAPAPAFGVTPPPAEMVRENSRLLDHAREARAAARGARCGVALEHAAKVRAIDPVFHDKVFARDPQILACIDPESVPRYETVLREVRADPPASGARIAGEVLLGMLTGAGGGIVGALLGGALCLGGGDDGDGGGGGDCGASAIGGAYLGAILTIPYGVRVAGVTGGQTGSAGMTFLGSALGGLGGLLMLASGRDEITALGLVFAPTIGAVIGFNSTRRYRPRSVRVRVSGALVDWSGGAVALGVPLVTRARAEERAVTSVPLLGGTF